MGGGVLIAGKEVVVFPAEGEGVVVTAGEGGEQPDINNPAVNMSTNIVISHLFITFTSLSLTRLATKTR